MLFIRKLNRRLRLVNSEIVDTPEHCMDKVIVPMNITNYTIRRETQERTTIGNPCRNAISFLEIATKFIRILRL